MLAAICIAVMPVFLGMFTKQVGIIGMGVQYSDIVFLFAVPNAAALCFEKIFQAVGRMKTSMFCMLLGCVTNIVLDPLLIFGIGIFPAMGIQGAALATGIGPVSYTHLFCEDRLTSLFFVKLKKDRGKF